MNAKKELFYFIKAIVLVIIFNGLLSAVMILVLLQGDVADSGNAMQALGHHVIWIVLLSLLLTTYVLHESRKITEYKRFFLEFAKVFIYFALVTLFQNMLR